MTRRDVHTVSTDETADAARAPPCPNSHTVRVGLQQVISVLLRPMRTLAAAPRAASTSPSFIASSPLSRSTSAVSRVRSALAKEMYDERILLPCGGRR